MQLNGTDLDVDHLRTTLQGVRPTDNLEDTAIWHWEGTKCPEKIRVFLWLVSKKLILTWPRLQARVWSGPNMFFV